MWFQVVKQWTHQQNIVKAIEQVNAKNVVICPNNKNIFMAAQSAAEVVDVNAAVEARTVPQGFKFARFDPSQYQKLCWSYDS